MARGKIQIRRIENSTTRQVTYSKRRSGLFKKANELTVLCDATVSIIMFSSNNKLHEFLSPGVSMKQIYDRYQETTGIDIWITHYQRMQADLQKLNEKNRNLQREIRQRMGDCLEDLSFDQLLCLEQDVENAVQFIRQRKYKVISTQIDTKKKKVRNEREIHKSLLEDFDVPKDEPQYGLVDNGDYNHVLGYDNGSHVLALRLQPCPPPSLHVGGPGSGTGSGSCVTTYTLL